MKILKHLFVIAIAFLTIMTISSAIVCASDAIDDDVTPNNLSKKELAKIEKSYDDVWNNIKYYRVTKAVKLKVTFYDKNIEGKGKSVRVKIPKGTILSGDKQHIDGPKGTVINSFEINSDTLSYRLLKPVISTGTNLLAYNATANAKKMSSINKYFSRIKRPAYMPAYSSGSLYIYPLNKKKFSPFGAITNRLKITPDGYLEFTKNNSPEVETNKEFNLTPDAHIKISKAVIKNNTRYLYYAHHLEGVSDKKVAKTGKNMYRLAITNLHRPFSMFDGDQGAVLMSRYKVGSTVYYTESGGYSA
ncbi:hypothetical protein FEZ41_10695 [Lentilactobacillus parafarraginis]|uniref:Uncharacterized protein n=1 Tax=Lentilactobacillus parafarraginis TaxID=390842 RepID=A0A5R9CRF4_9LACO|nr:hypothetical protein [Lentilactobacillus parafarraginis]TLQ17962.1 hypothetical protein FEZ41_10695 [Lentilactobacillus parafarraginis]